MQNAIPRFPQSPDSYRIRSGKYSESDPAQQQAGAKLAWISQNSKGWVAMFHSLSLCLLTVRGTTSRLCGLSRGSGPSSERATYPQRGASVLRSR